MTTPDPRVQQLLSDLPKFGYTTCWPQVNSMWLAPEDKLATDEERYVKLADVAAVVGTLLDQQKEKDLKIQELEARVASLKVSLRRTPLDHARMKLFLFQIFGRGGTR